MGGYMAEDSDSTPDQTGDMRVLRDGDVEDNPMDIALFTIITPLKPQENQKSFKRYHLHLRQQKLVATEHSLKLCMFSKSDRRR